jgi:hypothetical protein
MYIFLFFIFGAGSSSANPAGSAWSLAKPLTQARLLQKQEEVEL